MVRSTIAFAVVAFGAAAVIAQAPDMSELDARDYEVVEARGFEDMVDIDARQPEFFDHIEAREYEAEQLVARDFNDEFLEARDASLPPGGQNPMPMNSYPSYNPPVLAAPGPTPVVLDAASPVPTPTPTVMPAGGDVPSRTVTITRTPTPTPCTKRQAKRQKQMAKIKEAVAIVRAAKGHESQLSKEEKNVVKKATKYLKSVRRRKVKAAKRTIKKCKAALKKAKLTVKDCKAGADCESAYLAEDLTLPHCKAAFKYMKRVKAAKKAEKKGKDLKGGKKSKKTDSDKTDSHKTDSHKKSKKSKSKSKAKMYSDLLTPTKTTKVGADGITTVVINAGPTCTAVPDSGSKSSKSSKLVARDEEVESMFAREYDFDNLD